MGRSRGEVGNTHASLIVNVLSREASSLLLRKNAVGILPMISAAGLKEIITALHLELSDHYLELL